MPATTGSVYIDASFTGEHGEKVRIGRLLVGQNALLNAPSFRLKRIMSFVANPWYGQKMTAGTQPQNRSIVAISGSIGSLTSIGSLNYVQVNAVRAFKKGATLAYGGTLVIGTNAAGSFRSSFIVVGR